MQLGILSLKLRRELLCFIAYRGTLAFLLVAETGDSFTSAVAALEKCFKSKVNIAVERHAFKKWAQALYETITQYVAALRDLASRCRFDDKMDEMIRDQLIEYVTNSNTGKRLLLEPDA